MRARLRPSLRRCAAHRLAPSPRRCSGGGVGKETHQLELPEAAIAGHGRALPSEWQLMSSKKGARRYWTPAIRAALSQLEAAKADREAALAQEHRAVFRRCARQHGLCSRAVACVGHFDCLQSLGVACAAIPGLSLPKIVPRGPATGGRPLLRVEGGFHLLAAVASGGSFVANELALGGSRDGSCGTDGRGGPEPVAALVTGPNMGGKSTLLRQTALLTLMAQLGCLVPAKCAELTPADAIFTRVGAADRILAGHSTFRVELEETAAILQDGTQDSLVILDELGEAATHAEARARGGARRARAAAHPRPSCPPRAHSFPPPPPSRAGRGTATFDGMAIAHAVLRHLVESVGCRTLFATHYHLLAEAHEGSAAGASVHRMACAVEEGSKEVTFLYRLERGACLRSHGVNVARLAGLPQPLLDSAAERSARMERTTSAARPGAGAASTRARAAELVRQVAAAADSLARAEEPATRETCARQLRALQAEAKALVDAAAALA